MVLSRNFIRTCYVATDRQFTMGFIMRKIKTIQIVFILLTMFVLITAGCLMPLIHKSTYDWRDADWMNTIGSYESFIQRHPDSPQAKTALKRITGFIWSEHVKKKYNDAVTFGSIEAYEHFLNFCMPTKSNPSLNCASPPSYLGATNFQYMQGEIENRMLALVSNQVRASLPDYVSGRVIFDWTGDGYGPDYELKTILEEFDIVHDHKGQDTPDVVLTIKGNGTMLSETYYPTDDMFKPIPGEPGQVIYTGARINGTIELKIGEWLFFLDFNGLESTSYNYTPGTSDGHGPLMVALNDANYHEKVLYLINTVFAPPRFLEKMSTYQEDSFHYDDYRFTRAAISLLRSNKKKIKIRVKRVKEN